MKTFLAEVPYEMHIVLSVPDLLKVVDEKSSRAEFHHQVDQRIDEMFKYGREVRGE